MIHESVAVTISLPDDRLVLQRRDVDAPSAKGMLAVLGGGVEDFDICRHHAALRELDEELGADEVLEIEFAGDLFYVSRVYDKPIIRISAYSAKIALIPTGLLEGSGVEVYHAHELTERPDVATSTMAIITNAFRPGLAA